jgi:serine protease Do
MAGPGPFGCFEGHVCLLGQVSPQTPARPSNAAGATVAVPQATSYLGIWLWERAGAVEVTLVQPGGPAEMAGIQIGDVIAEFDGQKVTGSEQLARFVRETPAGRGVKLQLIRVGVEQVVKVKLGAIAAADRPGPIPSRDLPRLQSGAAEIVKDQKAKEQKDVQRNVTTWRSPMLGVEAEPVSGQLAAFFGASEAVLVRAVNPGSPAEKAGIKAGDLITKVAKQPVATPAEITARLRVVTSPVVPVTVLRDRKELQFVVTLE